MDGILIVAKPSGVTSHDVVDIVRRRMGIRRVGHAGTLDPLAEGVLVILLGRATRLAEFMSGQDKQYEATLLLGIATRTEDVEGEITSERSAAGVSAESLFSVLGEFRGSILQTPPMYSAVKVGGQRLYRLARAGKTIERQPRRVTIRQLTLKSFSPGERARAVLICTVSAGCYIRTLCADIGERLGVGGCMESLLRTASGSFGIDGALPLSEIEANSRGDLMSRVLAPAVALESYPRVDLDAAAETLFCHGGSIEGNVQPGADVAPDRIVRVHGAAGQLLGIGEFDSLAERIRPLKVICDAGAS